MLHVSLMQHLVRTRGVTDLVCLDFKTSLVVNAIIVSSDLCNESRNDSIERYSIVVSCPARSRLVQSTVRVEQRGSDNSPSKQSCTKLRTALGASRFHSSINTSPKLVLRTTRPEVIGSVTLNEIKSCQSSGRAISNYFRSSCALGKLSRLTRPT